MSNTTPVPTRARAARATPAAEPAAPSRASLPPQSISAEVLAEKYAKGDEATLDDVRQRVARALAEAEAPEQRAAWEAKFLDAFTQRNQTTTNTATNDSFNRFDTSTKTMEFGDTTLSVGAPAGGVSEYLPLILAGGIIWGTAGMILFVPFLGILKVLSDKTKGMEAISMLLSNK
jgi:hypothetical protein